MSDDIATETAKGWDEGFFVRIDVLKIANRDIETIRPDIESQRRGTRALEKPPQGDRIKHFVSNSVAFIYDAKPRPKSWIRERNFPPPSTY